MLITRQSMLTGKTHSLEIPLSVQEFKTACRKYEEGAFIQDAFSSLTPELREFILTGITPEEWEVYVNVEED